MIDREIGYKYNQAKETVHDFYKRWESYRPFDVGTLGFQHGLNGAFLYRGIEDIIVNQGRLAPAYLLVAAFGFTYSTLVTARKIRQEAIEREWEFRIQ